MAEFNWTVDDIKRAQRDFSNNFMWLDCIRTESYDVAIDCMTECIEKKAADVQPIRRGHWEDSGNFYFKKCSECGSKWDISITNNIFAHYCPRCGADMRDVPDTDVGEIANVVEFKKRMERE